MPAVTSGGNGGYRMVLGCLEHAPGLKACV
jgi:hypothetical protein